jgi:hypothetical protein
MPVMNVMGSEPVIDVSAFHAFLFDLDGGNVVDLMSLEPPSMYPHGLSRAASP